jgi:Flp pilus assembly protein TadB
MVRRLRLGDEIEHAVASLRQDFGSDAESVSLLFAINNECGGDLAAMTATLATEIEDRARRAASARTSGAGAILSARIVAGLPLICVPLLPVSHAPLFDAAGLIMIGVGIALALGAIWWINGLVPLPAGSDDPVATFADVVAGLQEAGLGLRPALDQVARRAPGELGETLQRAHHRVRLGCTWPGALSLSGQDDLCALAGQLETSQSLGVPAAAALRRFAAEVRSTRAREFEELTRRAPVLMALPLVLCALPSFLLLGLGPFLRGLSLR